MKPMDDIENARKTMFFGSLPGPVFDRIMKHARIVTLDAGQTLFHEGEPAEAVFAVLSGLVKITVSQRDGAEVVVDTFHQGMSFAEAIIFEHNTYPVTATALEASRLLAAPAHVVRGAIRDEPDAIEAILAATYRHLHRLVRQIEQLKSASGVVRLGRYIMTLDEAVEDGATFELPIEKRVLASLLGIQPETLSRALKKLQSHGVEVQGRSVRVTDTEALARFVERD